MRPVDPGWPAQFLRSHPTLTFKSYVKFLMCSYERAGSLGSWDFRFSNQNLGKWARKFCHINTSAQFLGWKWGRPCLDGIILLCMLYFPNHKHPILITAVIQSSIKVAKATIGVKVITLCFTMFALFLEFCTTNSNEAEISHMNPRWNYWSQ